MAFYTPTSGIITNIENTSGNSAMSMGCGQLITLQSEDQGLIQVFLSGNTYVLNLNPFQVGDRATFFYRASAPVPLIYPPRYNAVAAAYTPYGTTATLDVFGQGLTNSDNTLVLVPGITTTSTYANGQPYTGNPGGSLILALYSSTTRSIPAQTVPDQMVVFCR